MSARAKSRTSAAVENATLSVNEKILRECHELYTEEEVGLIEIAKDIGIPLLAPRKKITVMLIGNHSAGKSTFINWYVEEHVQKTGVAIETQGFTIVTSGKKRESLTGNATFHLYPHLQPLQDMQGVMDYISTEITTSKQKKFSLVTFIDTPGLVDGDMKYPFDVNKSITWIGENIADLIFVFFDPIGQALCKRTLNIVEHLSEDHAEKMKFYLSKADEAGHESDRQRVMMQIVQELCKRPNLNRTGFDMPTIFVPTLGKQSRCVNQIESVCKEVEKTINATIQNTLNTLEKDCLEIADKIDRLIEQDNGACSHNLRAKGKGFGLFMLGSFLPIVVLANFLAVSLSKEALESTFGVTGAATLKTYTSPVSAVWSAVPEQYFWHSCGVFALITLMLLFVAVFVSRSLPTMSRKRKRNLLHGRDFVLSEVKVRKEALYKEYLKQSVAAYDM
ncbi:uncharacterized protein LOC143449129 [Clavelina lepadiformis]|uniref:Dynamin N-terminal domain-containing protein n=1 Tax=Clavelina lepadiformis TaxID=159417 RepID=A0ABP0GIX2_CLALP